MTARARGSIDRFAFMLSAALFCLVVAISDGDTLKLRCGEAGAFRQLTVRLHAVSTRPS